MGGVDRKGKRLGLFDALRQPVARRQGRAIAFLHSFLDDFSKVFLTSGGSLFIAIARKAAKGDAPFNFKGFGGLNCNAQTTAPTMPTFNCVFRLLYVSKPPGSLVYTLCEERRNPSKALRRRMAEGVGACVLSFLTYIMNIDIRIVALGDTRFTANQNI